MRNRQIIEYLICVREFKSLSVLYKGEYCICLRMHHTSANNTTTHAFPLHLHPRSHPPPHEPHHCHLTSRVEINYEEQAKPLEQMCAFRLQYDISKSYQTYLTFTLHKKLASKNLSEGSFCVRRVPEINYQLIDTVEYQLKPKQPLRFERISFEASEFHSCLDISLISLSYGYSYFANKAQMASTIPVSPVKQVPVATSDETKRAQQKKLLKSLLKQAYQTLPILYRELASIFAEYQRLLGEVNKLEKKVRKNLRQNIQSLEWVAIREPITIDKLFSAYETGSPQEIIGEILMEKQFARKNIRRVRQYLQQLLLKMGPVTFERLVYESEDSRHRRQFSSLFKPCLSLDNTRPNSEKQRQESALSLMSEVGFYPVKAVNRPLVYIEGSEELGKRPRGKSLTVLIHGYQGCSFDFQKTRNYIKMTCKDTQVIILESISDRMEESIESLGTIAAHQIDSYIDNSVMHFTALNLVGFSLGGLIARAALKHLTLHKKIFNTLITFSSPHLGISQNDNSLVNLGVWFLIKVDKVANLKELNFQSVNPHESSMMRLAKCELLKSFKRVIVVCSRNDEFVPFYSTSLDRNACQGELTTLCDQLQKNITKLQRVEVLFDIKKAGTLDRLTGRRGHIEFLDNDFFLAHFFRHYSAVI